MSTVKTPRPVRLDLVTLRADLDAIAAGRLIQTARHVLGDLLPLVGLLEVAGLEVEGVAAVEVAGGGGHPSASRRPPPR